MVGGASSSLHEAARVGNVEAVRQLVSDDPEALNARDRHSRTPLHLAAWAGQVDVVRALCDAGTDVGASALDDMAAIHFASQKGHGEVVHILLSSGAYVNAKNRKGMTPLHYAVQGRYEDLVKFLIKKGANLSTENRAGKKPIDLVPDDSFHTLISDAEIERNARRAKSNKMNPSLVKEAVEVERQVEETEEIRPITVAERPIIVPERPATISDRGDNEIEKPITVAERPCIIPNRADNEGENGETHGSVTEHSIDVEVGSETKEKENKSFEPRRKKAKVSLSHLSFDENNEEEMALGG